MACSTSSEVQPDASVPSGQSIAGLVTSKAGDPIAGAFVSAYGLSTTSDAGGRFQLDGLTLPAQRAVVSFQKEGYFDAVVGTRPAATGTTNVRVVLRPRTKIGEVDNATGGNVSGENITLDLPPRSFVGTDGLAVTGPVSIFASYLDPTSDDFEAQMPGGDFTAEDEQGEEGVLESFGAVTVEAEDESGEGVQLDEEAQLCIAIPAALRASAPAEIAVWILRPSESRWQASGTAQRQGDSYCFTQSELGNINCDLFFRSAIVSGRVCDDEGAPVADAEVEIGQIATRSDSSGAYSVVVPSGKRLQISVGEDSSYLCTVDANTAYTVDFGACPNAEPGEERCAPEINHGSTWTDSTSGLTWQTPAQPGDNRSFFKHAEALAYCGSLQLEGGGWRLPTIHELRTLVRGCDQLEETCDLSDCGGLGGGCCGACNNAVALNLPCYWPQEVFGSGSCSRSTYWSSSMSGLETLDVWVLEFARGGVGGYSSTGTTEFICVR